MRWTRHRTAVLVSAGLLLGALGCGGGGAKRESFNVTVSYVLEPTQKLPDGLRTVAVLDSGTEIQGGAEEEREKKWAEIAADGIEQLLQDSATDLGSALTIAKRRDTRKVLAEKDMKAAGLVEGNAAVEAGKLLDVQALITSKLNIQIDTRKSKRKTLGMSNIASMALGRGSGGSPQEVEGVSRNLIVQCRFGMVDAATGQAIFDYENSYRKLDEKEPGPFFGRSAGEGDLDSVDLYIGELVNSGIREFVSSFVPTKVSYTYVVESAKSEESAAGVAAMRSDDLDSAKAHLEAAIAENPEDSRSTFALGIVSELKGDWDAALKYYQQACGMRGVDKELMDMYVSAKNRVAKHKDRIRKA